MMGKNRKGKMDRPRQSNAGQRNNKHMLFRCPHVCEMCFAHMCETHFAQPRRERIRVKRSERGKEN